MPLLSIIVPIYKVEKYLPVCIESILSQTFEDFELVLVNDGSPDNSSKICAHYAELDSRIKVINKKNGGLSDARNAGLEVASGEFIIFVDGDDYMKEMSLGKVMSCLKEVSDDIDMLICPLIKTYPKKENVIDYLPIDDDLGLFDQKDTLLKMVISKTTFWGAGKNIYRNSIIKHNNLRFEKNLIGAEDCEFFMRYIRYCKKNYLINIPIVHYRLEREGSITNVMSSSAILGQLKVFHKHYHYYKYENKERDITVYSFFANKFANTISLLPSIRDKKDIKQICEYIESKKNIMNDTKGKKYNFAKIVWSLFGWQKGSAFILRIKQAKLKSNTFAS